MDPLQLQALQIQVQKNWPTRYPQNFETVDPCWLVKFFWCFFFRHLDQFVGVFKGSWGIFIIFGNLWVFFKTHALLGSVGLWTRPWRRWMLSPQISGNKLSGPFFFGYFVSLSGPVHPGMVVDELKYCCKKIHPENIWGKINDYIAILTSAYFSKWVGWNQQILFWLICWWRLHHHPGTSRPTFGPDLATAFQVGQGLTKRDTKSLHPQRPGQPCSYYPTQIRDINAGEKTCSRASESVGQIFCRHKRVQRKKKSPEIFRQLGFWYSYVPNIKDLVKWSFWKIHNWHVIGSSQSLPRSCRPQGPTFSVIGRYMYCIYLEPKWNDSCFDEFRLSLKALFFRGFKNPKIRGQTASR